MSETRAMTHITDVRTVAIPVAAHEAALDFYVGKLGFEQRIDATFGDGERWIEVAPPGASTTVALLRRAGESGTHPGVRLTSEDVAADHAQLLALGVDADAEIIPFPVPMFALRDPDGTRLVIVGRGG